MNTRSLIKAHRLALPVINFPMLLHWQPAISATDSQLPAASEASAAGEEKPWFRGERDLPLPFCSSVLGRSHSMLPALRAPKSWDGDLLPGPSSSLCRKGLVVHAQCTSDPEGAEAWLSGEGGTGQGGIHMRGLFSAGCFVFSLSPPMYTYIYYALGSPGWSLNRSVVIVIRLP